MVSRLVGILMAVALALSVTATPALAAQAPVAAEAVACAASAPIEYSPGADNETRYFNCGYGVNAYARVTATYGQLAAQANGYTYWGQLVQSGIGTYFCQSGNCTVTFVAQGQPGVSWQWITVSGPVTSMVAWCGSGGGGW